MGRNVAHAARSLGYRVRAFDTDPSCTVGALAERSLLSTMEDSAGAADVLAGCDVVTPSVEHVPARTLAAIESAGTPIRPAPGLFGLAQDRRLEREWLEARGIPLVPWRPVSTLSEALTARSHLGGGCLLKPCVRTAARTHVRRVDSAEAMASAWMEYGAAPCVVEREVEIDREFSVVVARGLTGSVVTYPAAESVRGWQDGVPRLLWSVLPAGGEQQHAEKARRLASLVTERLGAVGLLSVEMFLLTDGRLVVNELVPCPHRTFIASAESCATGQDEQLVRAITGLPLGSAAVVRRIAVAPIYGDDWRAGASTRVDAALRMTGVALHLDGIEPPVADQRVGHLAVAGDSPEQAVARAMRASAHLVGRGAG
jgi:5-(carboxyamino)imidazole ribonucleotide synthase